MCSTICPPVVVEFERASVRGPQRRRAAGPWCVSARASGSETATGSAQRNRLAHRREPGRVSMAKAMRTNARRRQPKGASTAPTVRVAPRTRSRAEPIAASERMPDWLRDRHADIIRDARGAIVRQAKREMASGDEGDAGVLADKRIKAVLAAAGGSDPSPATVRAYRRDYALMLAEARTPLDKAETFQHWNRLRSAWRFCEVEAIRALRLESESARKKGNYRRMREITVEAFERATLFHAMFLDEKTGPGRETWGKKAAERRARGVDKPSSKSKRAAGRVALSPDQLLARLAGQKRGARVEVAAAVSACFGVRPAELVHGVRLRTLGDQLALTVQGAKVDARRGQPERYLAIRAAAVGKSALAVALLRAEVQHGRENVKISPAELATVRRAMRAAQPGLSPYAYRHARSSDAKALHGKAGAAAWLGHRTDRAQSGYGNARSSSGGVTIVAAAGTHLVRRVKSLPTPRIAQAGAKPRAETFPDRPRPKKRLRGPR